MAKTMKLQVFDINLTWPFRLFFLNEQFTLNFNSIAQDCTALTTFSPFYQESLLLNFLSVFMSF